VLAQTGGLFIHQSYLLHWAAGTGLITATRLPRDEGTSLYCKALALRAGEAMIFCSITSATTAGVATVLVGDQDSQNSADFKPLFKYSGRQGYASASLGFQVLGDRIYTGIEERWSDRALVRLGTSRAR
jgi:hypothetical protein